MNGHLRLTARRAMTRAGSRRTTSTNEKISVSIVVPTYEERVNVALLYLLIRESERAYGSQLSPRNRVTEFELTRSRSSFS